MQAEVRGDDHFGSQAAAGFRIRECPTEKAAIRADFGTGRALGCAKKVLEPSRRRITQQVLVRDWGLSIRSSCHLAGLSRSHLNQPRLIADDALKAEIWRLTYKHPRFGYRRIHALLKGLGWQINFKRVRRIWREEGLQVRKKLRRLRRRRKGTGVTALVPERPTHTITSGR